MLKNAENERFLSGEIDKVLTKKFPGAILRSSKMIYKSVMIIESKGGEESLQI